MPGSLPRPTKARGTKVCQSGDSPTDVMDMWNVGMYSAGSRSLAAPAAAAFGFARSDRSSLPERSSFADPSAAPPLPPPESFPHQVSPSQAPLHPVVAAQLAEVLIRSAPTCVLDAPPDAAAAEGGADDAPRTFMSGGNGSERRAAALQSLEQLQVAGHRLLALEMDEHMLQDLSDLLTQAFTRRSPTMLSKEVLASLLKAPLPRAHRNPSSLQRQDELCRFGFALAGVVPTTILDAIAADPAAVTGEGAERP